MSGAGYRDELERHFANDAGQSHAANGCPEEYPNFRQQNMSRGCHRPELISMEINMVAEGAFMVMIFAMHIRRHAAAQRNKFRSQA
jgi:hypothetical protein